MSLNPFAIPGPFWMIGCGNMAGAMLAGWLDAGFDPKSVVVVRPSGQRVAPGVTVFTALPDGSPPALAMLGVKPQKLDEIAPALAPRLGPDTILVSILAGVELAALRARFPEPRTIVRAMPNTPVRLRKGVVDLLGEGRADDLALVETLMSALGHAEWFKDEASFAAAGHLTGAGPAFLFRFIDALAHGGEAIGLPADQAARLALLMAEGAAALAAASPESPAELAARVASPGGTTQAGLAVLDGEEALRGLLARTLEASRRRGAEMAEAARAR